MSVGDRALRGIFDRRRAILSGGHDERRGHQAQKDDGNTLHKTSVVKERARA